MDTKIIVKKFLECGILLSPNMLAKIDETNIGFFLKKAEEGGSVVFSEIAAEKEKINVSVKGVVEKETLTPKDITAYYTNKYNGVKRLLLEKMQPVSIKNAGRHMGDASIIGIAREVTPTGFILEDNTGKTDVMAKQHTITNDDVVGVVGSAREGALFAKEIIFPDVPENLRLRKISGVKVVMRKSSGKNVIIVKEQKEEKTITDLPNPAWITVSRGNNEVVVVAYDPQRNTTVNEAIQYLVKRHLSPPMGLIKNSEDYFLLDPLPDILWIINSTKWAKTYKGITVISVGDGSAAIDLGTREVEFVE